MAFLRLPPVKGGLKYQTPSLTSSSYSSSANSSFRDLVASLPREHSSKKSFLDGKTSSLFGGKRSKESHKKIRVVGVDQQQGTEHLSDAILRFEKMDDGSKAVESKPRHAPEDDMRTYQEMAAMEHKRLANELRMKKAGNEIRQNSLLERTTLLQTTIKMFDSFIREVERKYTRARYQINRNRIEMRSLDNQKFHMYNIIDQLSEVQKKRKEMHINNPVLTFMDKVVAVSGYYKTPADLLNRFHAMQNNLQALMVRYEADLGVQEKLMAEQQDLHRKRHLNIMYLRKRIITLKERLNLLKSENLLLSNETSHMTDGVMLVEVELHTAKTAIHNLALLLMNFRPFTARKMTKAGKQWQTQIEEIGRIIALYNEIIASQRSGPQTRRTGAVQSEEDISEEDAGTYEHLSTATYSKRLSYATDL